jgi:head-tail adaptor
MALYSRDGVWHWRKMISGHKFDRTTKTANKKEAERIAAQWEADAVREIQIMGNRPMDLHACIHGFLAAQKGQPGAPNAEVHLRHFLAIPDCRMGEVRLSQLQKVVDKRRAQGTAHNTLVVTTSYWNAVVNFAEKQKWSTAPKLPAMKNIKTRLRYLSDAEEAAIFRVIDPMGDYPGNALALIKPGRTTPIW